MEDRFENFMLLTARINKYVRRIKAEEMELFNLKSSHALCIYYLYKNKRLNMTALSKRCGEDKAALSRAIDFLKAEGYIEAKDSSGYKHPLRLTEKGILAGEGLSERIEGILSITARGIDEEEREVMYSTLEKIAENLEEIYFSYDGQSERKSKKAIG